MSVTVSSVGPDTTARVRGEVDTSTAPEVLAAFERLPITPGGTVVVDLREVDFLDSSGLGAIVRLHRRVEVHGARLRLVCGSATLRLVRIMHLDQVIEVVDGTVGPGTTAEGQDASIT